MCAVTQPSSASLPREMEGTSVDPEERHIPGALDGIRPKTHQVLIDGMDSIESTSSRLLLQLVVIHYLYQSKQPSTEKRQKWLSIRRSEGRRKSVEQRQRRNKCGRLSKKKREKQRLGNH